MRMVSAFGMLWLASSLMTPNRDARPTVLLQRGERHPGRATVDVSADGRFVAFESTVSLLPADRNQSVDIYVLDRSTGRVTLETSPPAHVSGDWAAHPRLSGDGRYLVFRGSACGVVPDGSGMVFPQVLLRDRDARTTILVSRTSAGAPANGPSGNADISDDGHTIVFESSATDLGGLDDRNGRGPDVYAFDAHSQTLQRVSVDVDGRQAAVGTSFAPSVSGDGQVVTFVSSARLAFGLDDQRSARLGEDSRHVYVRHLTNGFTRRVSAPHRAKDATGASFAPAVNRNGGRVAFVSEATNLVQGDGNGTADVYLYDVRADRTTLVSRSARGGTANGSSGQPAMSADGRLVAFASTASDLICAGRCPERLLDLNLVSDVYLLDTVTDRMTRVSVTAGGAPWWEASAGPSLDAAGDVITFSSLHPIDENDTRHDFDLFLMSLRELTSHLEHSSPSSVRVSRPSTP